MSKVSLQEGVWRSALISALVSLVVALIVVNAFAPSLSPPNARFKRAAEPIETGVNANECTADNVCEVSRLKVRNSASAGGDDACLSPGGELTGSAVKCIARQASALCSGFSRDEARIVLKRALKKEIVFEEGAPVEDNQYFVVPGGGVAEVISISPSRGVSIKNPITGEVIEGKQEGDTFLFGPALVMMRRVEFGEGRVYFDFVSMDKPDGTTIQLPGSNNIDLSYCF
ncbi:hypothetical protein D6817_04520 [Candidatus Pacearchaeota archaeon]|nr:MAG: hypothetical protein D6817_04520 [Candidatus Pacearchaeota archaeon]